MCALILRTGLVSVETYTACDTPPSSQQLQQLLQVCDVFSPNELEATSLVGPGSPLQLVDRLLAAGATTVALRRGPEGALVKHGPSGEAWQVGGGHAGQAVGAVGLLGCALP